MTEPNLLEIVSVPFSKTYSLVVLQDHSCRMELMQTVQSGGDDIFFLNVCQVHVKVVHSLLQSFL